MFHRLSETALQTDWPRARDALRRQGYVCFEDFLDRPAVDGLARDAAETAARVTPDGPCGVVRDSSGRVVLVKGVDKESDLLFDLARHEALAKIAQELLGQAAMPLRVDYLARGVDGGASPASQDHGEYDGHFSCENALSLWIALEGPAAGASPVEYARPTVGRLLPHRPSESPGLEYELADPTAFTFERHDLPRGGCSVRHSYTVYRVNRDSARGDWRALVLRYRGSPYREWLHERGGQ